MKSNKSALNQSLHNVEKRNIYELPKSAVLLIDKTKLVWLFIWMNNLDDILDENLEILRAKINPKKKFSDIVVFDVCDKLDQVYLNYFLNDIIHSLVRISLFNKDQDLRIKANEYLQRFPEDQVEEKIVELSKDINYLNNDTLDTINNFSNKVEEYLNNRKISYNKSDNITITIFSKLRCYIDWKQVKLDWIELKKLLIEVFHIDPEYFIENIWFKEKWYFLSSGFYNKTKDLMVLEKHNNIVINKLAKEFNKDIHEIEKIIIYKWYYTKKVTKNWFTLELITHISISEENIKEIQNYLEISVKLDKKDLK